MPELEDIRDHLGEVRRLGYVAPTDLGPRASRTNIQTLRSNAGLSPLIPQAQWTQVDFVTGYPLDLIEDQTNLGACTAFSATGAGARQRFMRTGKIVKTSGFYLYDQINGGRDRGSNIIDSMTIVESKGTPPADSYTSCKFREGLDPPGVEWYKEDLAVTVASSQECATALQSGMLCQAPILVTNSFENFTGDGVAWGGKAPSSSSSNHSIYLAGLKNINGTWYFILVNSWRPSWGPFRNGTCLIPMAAIDNAAMADDGYAHASTPDPNSSNLPVPSA